MKQRPTGASHSFAAPVRGRVPDGSRGATLPAGDHVGGGEGVDVPSVDLLRCVDARIYCGWTTDVARRVSAHAAGSASRYTRSRLPVELAAVIPVADRSAALREEARIKRLPRTAKLALIEALTES